MQTIFVERVLGAGPRLACRTPLMSEFRRGGRRRESANSRRRILGSVTSYRGPKGCENQLPPPGARSKDPGPPNCTDGPP